MLRTPASSSTLVGFARHIWLTCTILYQPHINLVAASVVGVVCCQSAEVELIAIASTPYADNPVASTRLCTVDSLGPRQLTATGVFCQIESTPNPTTILYRGATVAQYGTAKSLRTLYTGQMMMC